MAGELAYAQTLGDPNKLWMGDLDYTLMDETFLKITLARLGFPLLSVNWMQDSQTHVLKRYCYLDFGDPLSAQGALNALNNKPVPGTNKSFRLNWAGKKTMSGAQECAVLIAELTSDVTSQQILDFFQPYYSSVLYAKVIEDGKGYGFIQFFDEVERDLCCMEMNGKTGLGQKVIRVKPAIIPKDGTISSEELAAFDAQDVGQHYDYYHGQYGTDQSSGQYAGDYNVEEELEEFDPPLDIKALNREFYQRDKEMLMEIDKSKWAPIDSFTNVLPSREQINTRLTC